MAAAPDRILIVLPSDDRAIADAIVAHLERLGAGSGGRSSAIRYALRDTAARLGLLDAAASGKKKKPR